MHLITGIDALRAVASKEIDIILQAAGTFHHGKAFVLRHTRIYGGLVNHNVTLGNDLAYRVTGSIERTEVGRIIFIDGCRHCHNIEVTVADVIEIGGTLKAMLGDGFLQKVIRYF